MVRHRLNRGGDRALNRAIHTIVITRLRCCPTTKNHVARRAAEGKSSRDSAVPHALHRPRAQPRPQHQHHAHRPNTGSSSGRLTNIEASEIGPDETSFARIPPAPGPASASQDDHEQLGRSQAAPASETAVHGAPA